MHPDQDFRLVAEDLNAVISRDTVVYTGHGDTTTTIGGEPINYDEWPTDTDTDLGIRGSLSKMDGIHEAGEP